MVSTVGFTIFPYIVALVHKKPYVDDYWSVRRFGLEMGIVLVLFLQIVLVLFGDWRQIAKNDLGYDGQKSLGK